MEQVVLPIVRVRLRRLSPTEIETLKSISGVSSNRRLKRKATQSQNGPDIQRSSNATVLASPETKICRQSQSSLKVRINIKKGAESGSRRMVRNRNQKCYETEDDDTDYNPDSDEMELLKKGNGKVQAVEGRHRRAKIKRTSDEVFSIKCQKCPAFFNHQSKFDRHINSVHEDPSHQSDIHTCPICDRMIWRQLGFQTHLKYHTNAEDVEEEFNLWDRWPKPPGRKENNMSFSCKFCLMPHSSHHSFLIHMKSNHMNKGRCCNWTCRYCSTKEFNSIKLLVSHIKSDHRKEYYGSTKKWDENTIIATHQNGSHKMSCDICGELINIYRMKLHKIKEHSGASSGTTIPKKNIPSENTFQCPLNDCQKRLKTEQLLKQHFILHLQNNPFVCEIPGCGVRCGAQAHLNRHMKIHTGEKRVDCPKCGLSFSKKERLLVHVCGEDSSAVKKYADGSLRARFNRPRLLRFDKSEIDSFQETKRPKAGKKKKRININEIMLSDPVFIKACEKSPHFKRLMLDSMAKSKMGKQVQDSSDVDDDTVHACPQCEKELSCRASLRRHCLSMHGLVIPNGRSGPIKKNLKTKKKGKHARLVEKKGNEKQTVSDMTVPSQLIVKVELDLNIDADMNDEAESNQFAVPDASKIKEETDESHPIKSEGLNDLSSSHE